MASSAKRLLPMFITVLLLLTFFLPACTPARRPVVGFNPTLSLSEAPALGKPVKLTLTFTSVTPKGLESRELYYTGRIELPPGRFEVVEGDLETKGRNIPGETHSLEAIIKSIKAGEDAIYGRVALRLSSEDAWGTWDSDVLFVTITQDGATVSETMPVRKWNGYPVFDGNDPNKPPSVIPYDQVPLSPSGVSHGRRPSSTNRWTRHRSDLEDAHAGGTKVSEAGRTGDVDGGLLGSRVTGAYFSDLAVHDMIKIGVICRSKVLT